MTSISFSKNEIVLFSRNIPSSHMEGDPLPVRLVESALKIWAKEMGHGEDVTHVAPGYAWEKLRVGGKSFTYQDFLTAQKNPALAATLQQVAAPAATSRTIGSGHEKILEGKPAPEAWEMTDYLGAPNAVPPEDPNKEPVPTAPESWGIADEITLPKTSARQDKTPGPVMGKDGTIEWEATRERNFRADLEKLGAKPRSLKPDV